MTQRTNKLLILMTQVSTRGLRRAVRATLLGKEFS